MTPQENVDAILKQLGGEILSSGERISHLANHLDIAHQTISRILGKTDKPHKYGCSMPNVAKLAHRYGYELKLVPIQPLSPLSPGSLSVETNSFATVQLIEPTAFPIFQDHVGVG